MYERVDYRGPAMSHKWIMDNFFRTGGTVEWRELTDYDARAKFTHPETISVDIEKHFEKAETQLAFLEEIDKKELLRSHVMHEGIAEVYSPLIQQHWLNYTKSVEGKPNDDPVFDKYKTGEIIY